jgi:hypothetical protein
MDTEHEEACFRNYSLVSRVWLAPVQKALFSNLALGLTLDRHEATKEHQLRRLDSIASRPHLASYVHKLTFHSSRLLDIQLPQLATFPHINHVAFEESSQCRLSLQAIGGLLQDGLSNAKTVTVKEGSLIQDGSLIHSLRSLSIIGLSSSNFDSMFMPV